MITINERLHAFCNLINSPTMRQACYVVITHPEFPLAFGSSKRHHAYIGGLAEHTLEVGQIAWDMRSFGCLKVNTDVLCTAVIFHDFMKIRDYEPDGVKTQYHDQIRHVAGSYAEWIRISDQCDVRQENRDSVGHCILAHHGRKEWGSPIEPQTVEAQILHFADMLSMQYGMRKDSPDDRHQNTDCTI